MGAHRRLRRDAMSAPYKQGDPLKLYMVELAAVALRSAERELRLSVFQARRSGASWSVIAHALGTSRQAAQQRFGPD
jgi:hypothetical protein